MWDAVPMVSNVDLEKRSWYPPTLLVSHHGFGPECPEMHSVSDLIEDDLAYVNIVADTEGLHGAIGRG